NDVAPIARTRSGRLASRAMRKGGLAAFAATTILAVLPGVAGAAAAKPVTLSAPATAECAYPLALDCPRDYDPSVNFADVPAGTPSVKVTYKSTEYCAPMLLMVYDNGRLAGQTTVVGGDTGAKGAVYPNEGSTTFSLSGGSDHELSYRGKITGYGCGIKSSETLSLHLFTGTVEATFTPPEEGVTIKGTVRIAGLKGIPAEATGVPGATVQITGPGARRTVRVSSTGTYSARFKKAGTYDVVAHAPATVTRGLRNPVKPEFHRLSLKLGGTGTAYFTVKDPLRLAMTLSRKSVPASGLETLHATITATERGKPVRGQYVAIRPMGAASLPVYNLPVPATVCMTVGSRRIWPEPNPSPTAHTGQTIERTDSRGEIHLDITTGTIPGRFELSAWAANSAGALDTEHDILDVTPEETVNVVKLAGGGAFEGDLTSLLKSDPSISLPTGPKALATELAKLSASGRLGGFSFAPVRSGGKGYE